jgi:glucuronokinase
VGLAGSSAIITAAVKALMDFFGLTELDIPKPEVPNLIISVETDELGIQAGLQDRVVQTYGGLMYMDFAPGLLDQQGHGIYEQLPVCLLPPLYIAYADAPSDSGAVHSGIRYRYDQGDPEVRDGMRRFAELTDSARDALVTGDIGLFGDLMDTGFDLRRRLYGDGCLGRRNLEMIDLARSLGLPAAFPGSGGAIVGICETAAKFRRAREAFSSRGFQFFEVIPANGVAAGLGLRPLADTVLPTYSRVSEMAAQA